MISSASTSMSNRAPKALASPPRRAGRNRRDRRLADQPGHERHEPRPYQRHLIRRAEPGEGVMRANQCRGGDRDDSQYRRGFCRVELAERQRPAHERRGDRNHGARHHAAGGYSSSQSHVRDCNVPAKSPRIDTCEK